MKIITLNINSKCFIIIYYIVYRLVYRFRDRIARGVADKYMKSKVAAGAGGGISVGLPTHCEFNARRGADKPSLTHLLPFACWLFDRSCYM